MRKSIYIIITGAILFLTQYGILFPQTQPTITTTTVSNLTATTALSGGNITSDGGGTIVAKGVCWSTHSNPTIADNRTSDGTGIGPFDSNITGLLPSTMYHIRAYATNCAGTAYGNDFTFTTIDGPPVVITTPITAITQESVTVGGNVISDNADLKGIVYGTSPEPAVDVGDAQIASGGSGSGSYECSISGIPTNTLYYLRAYAENSFGYSYGEQLTVILRINQAGATVNDNDGNTYNTVKIGNQVWFTENLKTTRYSDGSSIPNLTLDADWIAEDGSAGHNGAYCWNSNNENYKNPYGALYNWYAANNGKLCPEGWHVPTDDDWSTLTTYLLGESVAGGKLKESSTTHWCSPNLGATNETGFTALPGGYRDLVGYFAPVEPCSGYGQWWSATENSSDNAWRRGILSNSIQMWRDEQSKKYGSSVRCVNNTPTATINGAILVCQNSADPDITFTGANGTGPYTFTYKVNGGDIQTVTTVSGSSVTVSAPTTIAGTFTYSLVSVEDAYSSNTITGNVTVIISPIPSATITGDGELCKSSEQPLVIFTGINGIPEYTFSYSVDGSEPMNISSSCTTADIYAGTETAGVHNYNLLTVTDSRGCVSSYTDQQIEVTVTGAEVNTVAATAVTLTAATLNGTVNANGVSTDVSFEYGTNPDYGNSVAATPGTVNETGETPVLANITSLNPYSTYHYRIVSETDGCIVYGNDMIFTTYNTEGITDADGNYYDIVPIGTQEWMAENLKTTKYYDGTPIPNVTDQTEWAGLTTPAYCWYDNDISYANTDKYGALYNWNAVNTYKLCPEGWHVPTENDYAVLAEYLGDLNYAGGKLKETGTLHWWSPNADATDEFAFTALPGGNRNTVDFNSMRFSAYFWLSSAKIFIESFSTTNESKFAWAMNIQYGNGHLGKGVFQRVNGASVRCIKGTVNLALSTSEASSVTQNSAITGGNIIYDGDSPVTDRGICWSTDSVPTVSDNVISGGSGTGSFITLINDLSANTRYYVRAYATNGYGTFYGDEISFITYKTDAITDIEGNFYNKVEIGTQVWMAENLKTTEYSNGDLIGTVDASTMLGSGEASPSYQWAYAENDGNVRTYGRLYTWYAANDSRGVCPSGWHLPSDDEWHQLILTIDPDAGTEFIESSVGGGKLKEIGSAHWINEHGGTDDYGFTALPGGMMCIVDGPFDFIHYYGYWWTTTEQASGAMDRDISSGNNIVREQLPKAYGCSVRCIQNNAELPTVATNPVTDVSSSSATGGGEITSDGGSPVTSRGICWSTSNDPTLANDHTTDGSGTGSFESNISGLIPGSTYFVRAYATNSVGTAYGNELSFSTTITDIDGNIYNTIKIGDQIWMKENLKTTLYNDGTTIPLVTDQNTWLDLSTPGYCWYENNEVFGLTYGALYNWYTVNTAKLCPTGWHVPTNAEWIELENYLISNGFNYDGSITGNKIAKSLAATANWAVSENTGAVGNTDYPEKRNVTGFSYLPAGCRNAFNGGFFDNGSNGDIWSSTEFDATSSWRRVTRFDITNLESGYPDKKFGFSVRCIKDETLPTVNTNPATYITPISALSGGNIISSGESDISRIGIVWSKDPGPDINDNRKDLQYDGNPSFVISATNLDPQTKYYVRAYAINEAGIAYGSEQEFTTDNNFAEITFNSTLPYSTVSDIEGNTYQTIQIGGQVWMAENLKTTKLNDGTSIPLVTDDNDLWSNLKAPAFSWYKNQESIYKSTFGALYNWYTVITGKLCPTGWHVPTYQEFNAIPFSGSLKETGFTHWVYPNEAATNTSGFTALPSGVRYSTVSPQFSGIGTYGLFWYSSEYVSLGLGKPHDYARTIIINNSSKDNQLIMGNFYLPKNHGESVRCVKNKDIIYVTNINDNGAGSLRAAIVEANGDGYTDVINFNIPGNGPFVIKPSSGNPLPALVNPVIIDGFSQPGSSASNPTMLIELDGSIAGFSEGTPIDGLTISSNQCTVKGLIITGFSGNGIKIIGSENFNTGNRISSNSIFNNGGIGIDLGGYGEDGVTENDENSTPAPDDDIGPNGYQNYPVLDKIVFSLQDVYLDGHLNSLPDQVYTLEFFASKLANTSGYGEGETYLGSATVTTDDDGNALFADLTFPYKTLYGDVITATATDQYGNTSEFSKAVGGLPEQELDNTTFNYYVNPAGIPNVANESKIVDAVKSAFKAWTDLPTADFTFNYVDVTEQQHAQIDGDNIVSFSDDEFLFGDWVLAVTAKTLELGPNDERTRILDADIVFNPTLVKHPLWNFGIADDVGNTGFFDIQSVTTHEAGHILGLYHTGVHNATMWFEMGQGIEKRSLEQDDKSWAYYLYPEPGTGFGSISGHISYGYDTNESIAGALVLAINTATQDTIHSYSNADGNYFIPGLPDGTYSVYIEPLDGDVRNRELWPKNISLYIYCNTTNIDYPGEFYSGTGNEGSAESEDQVATVSIQNASEVSNINFVTNMDITPPYVVSVTPPDISKSQDIGIRFSEPVDMSTLIIDNCYLIQSGGTEHIGGSYTEMKDDKNSILFYPDEALSYNTKYDLYITTGVTDLKGLALSSGYQSTFKTGQGDKKPPTIIGIIPTSGAEDVFVEENIVITFSEAMNKSSVQNSFSITQGVGQLGFAWDNENKTLKVTHSERFAEETDYTITVSTLAEDMSGNALEASVSSSFSTVEAAAPSVIVEPGIKLLTDVTVNTTILAVFSEPIDPGTIIPGTDGTFRLLKGDEATGTDIPGEFEYFEQNSQVVFRPDADLDFNQNYTIILSESISDVSKNKEHLAEDISLSFKTESKLTTPKIIFIDPPSEAVGAKVTIGGKGFDPKIANNEVIFSNSVNATIISASLTSLTVKVPEGAESGPIHVKVVGVQEDASSPYDFLVISALSDPCNEALGSGTTGANSRDVALDVSGAKAYVTNPGSNTVSVIDVETLTTEATIDVGEYPLKIDINPESTLAYVTNFGSRTVSVIDLEKNQEINKINVGINPYGVAVSPDGKRVYVANYSTPDVSVIDADATSGGYDHAIADITTGAKNRDLAMDANSALLVVAGDDGVKIIELFETQFGFDYSVTPAGQGAKTRDVGILTQAGLAVVSTMDGELMFIGITPGKDTFGSVVASGTYGARAGDVKPDFSGVFLYVTNPDEDQVTVYKMIYGGSGSEIGSYTGFSLEEYWTIPTGMSPQGLAINPTNDRLYVANEFGETGLTGSLSAVKICCGEKTPVDDIVAVTFYIKGMIGRGDIQESLGNMLINKLNEAISNIDKAKTKTAINNMKSFIDKVNELQSGNKITVDDADYLIAAANEIINKLKASKSNSEEPLDSFVDQDNILNIVTESGLGNIYPNPFNESVTINYEIAESAKGYEKVSIYIYDATGRLVGTAVDGDLQPGHYSTIWNGQYESGGNVPTGTYFVKFRTATRSEVKQIMLIR